MSFLSLFPHDMQDSSSQTSRYVPWVKLSFEATVMLAKLMVMRKLPIIKYVPLIFKG